LIIEKYSNISIHDEAPKYVGMLSSDIKNVYENILFDEYDHYSHQNKRMAPVTKANIHSNQDIAIPLPILGLVGILHISTTLLVILLVLLSTFFLYIYIFDPFFSGILSDLFLSTSSFQLILQCCIVCYW
jgi:uncharacterized membrane protein